MAKTTNRKSASTKSKSVKRSRTGTRSKAEQPQSRQSKTRQSKPKPTPKQSKTTPAPRKRRTPVPAPSPSPGALATDSIFAWEDDPGAPTMGSPIERPIPVAPTHGFATALRITGTVPTAGQHTLGSDAFRYWTAVDALERAAGFWASILPTGTRWFMGASLPVALDEGLDLNAYYDRTELAFFHEVVSGVTVYSGESPDIVAHELGHAVLDAIRPQLWDAAAAEPAAFHEAFGDISAILAALQLESMRKAVLLETEGKLYRNSRLSRVAEQLGWAIRQRHPDAVDSDSLRNAVNSFFYRDPQTLPPRAPAATLSSEPHSFARVFVGAFFEALAGMVPPPATSDGLLATATDAARLLVDAIFAAPIVPDYFSQIAAHMLESDHARFQGKYLEPLRAAFVRHGVLSLESTLSMNTEIATMPVRRAAASREAALSAVTVADMSIDGHRFGLGNRTLVVQAPTGQKRFAVAAAAPTEGSVVAPSPTNAVTAFLEDLFRLGRVTLTAPTAREGAAVVHPFSRKTHKLTGTGQELKLSRQCFACGLT